MSEPKIYWLDEETSLVFIGEIPGGEPLVEKSTYDQLLQRNNQLEYELDKSRDSHTKRIAELESENERLGEMTTSERPDLCKIIEDYRQKSLQLKDCGCVYSEESHDRLTNKCHACERIASLCLRAELHNKLVSDVDHLLGDLIAWDQYGRVGNIEMIVRVAKQFRSKIAALK